MAIQGYWIAFFVDGDVSIACRRRIPPPAFDVLTYSSVGHPLEGLHGPDR